MSRHFGYDSLKSTIPAILDCRKYQVEVEEIRRSHSGHTPPAVPVVGSFSFKTGNAPRTQFVLFIMYMSAPLPATGRSCGRVGMKVSDLILEAAKEAGR